MMAHAPLNALIAFVPKLQLGNALRQAPAWRADSFTASCLSKLELQDGAFQSWSLGTRGSARLGTRRSGP